jgi:hypothetical protein
MKIQCPFFNSRIPLGGDVLPRCAWPNGALDSTLNHGVVSPRVLRLKPTIGRRAPRGYEDRHAAFQLKAAAAFFKALSKSVVFENGLPASKGPYARPLLSLSRIRS